MLTICYFTYRRDPKIRWFFESLSNQLPPVPHENYLDLVVIDYWGRADEIRAIADEYGNLPSVRVYRPKPCVWQGAHRLTKRDYFAASNSRNTGFIVAAGDYFVGVDDLSVLMPGWYDQVKHAYENGYLVLGAYKKVRGMVVENGLLVKHEEFPAGIDSRLVHAVDGIRPFPHNQLFGCSFGVPMAAVEAVGGMDEICDPIGGEDYHFGVRLERVGVKCFYNGNMMTYESEEGHHTGEAFLRVDKPTPGNPDGHDSSHVILNQVLRPDYVMARGNHFDLAHCRKIFKEKGHLPGPAPFTTHWPDNQPLTEM